MGHAVHLAAITGATILVPYHIVKSTPYLKPTDAPSSVASFTKEFNSRLAKCAFSMAV